MEQVKLLSMTAVLTVLTWAGANSLVNETGVVRVRFEVVPRESSDMLVEIAPAAKSRLYEVHILGPRKAVEKVQTGEPLLVPWRVAERALGSAAVPLDRDALKRNLVDQRKVFRRLRVVSVEPDTLPIVVDRMVTHDLAITLSRLTLAYEDAPQLRRNTIVVHLRESVYRELTATGDRLQADLSGELERLLRSKSAGQRVTVSVPLNPLPFGRSAELVPDRIDVTATVMADRQTVEIATVPIKPVVSFANLAKSYVAVARDGTPLTLVTQSITVTGPTEEVEKLVRGDTRAYGFIQLKEADLEELGVYRARVPEFHLPPGIELAAQPQVVEFKLVSNSNNEHGS